jgi:hypothetical protein
MKLRIPGPVGRLAGTLMAAVLAVALLPACSDEPQRERRMQMVKLLPDAPPPPPPPPPKEKPPEPPKSDKPPPDSKQPEAEPSNQLKSDEAAGDGPGNGLVAGTVTLHRPEGRARGPHRRRWRRRRGPPGCAELCRVDDPRAERLPGARTAAQAR